MPYVSLECEWTLNGKPKSMTVSRPAKDDEDYIATQIVELKEEFPKAKNIKVWERPYNEGYPFAVDALIDFIIERRPDLDRALLEDLHWLILNTKRQEYSRSAYILSLPEAKAHIEDEESDFRDWVYIRELGAVIFDVTKNTSHEIFLCHWYNILTKILPTKADFEKSLMRLAHRDEDGEKFLHECCGFYLSSAYGVNRVIKSTNMRLTAQEKMVFKSYTFRDMEPD